MSTRLATIAMSLASILILLLAWHGLSSVGGERNFLPGPLAVGKAGVGILSDSRHWIDVAATARRVLIAFGLAFSAAVIIGIIAGSNWVTLRLLTPPLVIGLTIPAICWTAIAVMLFGLGDWTAIFSGAVIVTPVIASSVSGQMRALDGDLYIMARVYGMPPYTVLRHLILPQLLPALLSSARYGLALCWKVVIIAELLGLSTGVGYQIAYWYSLFSLTNVFAWTLVFVLLMLAIEYGIIAPIEEHLLRWKKVS